jgi:hypothetical protein
MSHESENKNTIEINFIVNGQDQPETVNIHEPLSAARNKALADSNNTGRPMDEWKILDDKGDPLDPTKKIEDYNFASGVTLTLTLGSGAGG